MEKVIRSEGGGIRVLKGVVEDVMRGQCGGARVGK